MRHFVIAAALLSQASATPAGVIRGRVVTSDGRPVKQVIVRALGATVRMQRGALTDDAGRYELKDLAADTYRITVTRAGYVAVDTARRGASAGTRVALRDGEALERVDIVVARGTAITGRVTDEDGEPVEGADVQALRVEFANGHRQVMEGGRSRRTNDLGQFRLYGLMPGQYLITVSPATTGTNRLPGYPVTYFPGTPLLAESQFVVVELGRDVQNADVRLSPGRMARISGGALGADGQAFPRSLILANSQRSGGLIAPPRRVAVQPDGTFEIANVARGEYVLQTQTFAGDQFGEFATQYVSVGDEDVKGVSVRASRGSVVLGRIVLEGDAQDLKPSSFAVVPFPADFDLAPMIGNGYRAQVRPDWKFAMNGLFGPVLLRLGNAPDGWMLKSVRSGGSDITDTPLLLGRPNQTIDDVEVVLTDRSAGIAGTVSDARSQPVTDFAVIVFATDKDRWYRESRFLKFAPAALDGSFSLGGLPSGEYWVAAVDWLQPSPGFGEWQDPEVLELLARSAARVRLADGQHAQMALKLIAR